MSPDEARILEAWARGAAGISIRLTRRAWLILQEHQRAAPTALAQAWGTAAGAQGWVAAYHAKGLVGLMDKPRSGRPARTRASAARELRTLMEAGSDASAEELLARLPRNVREAIWRANRLSGNHIERRHHRPDLPLPAPPGCKGLVALFASEALIVLASFPQRTRKGGVASAGVWLEASTRGLAGPKATGHGANVLGALRLMQSLDDAAKRLASRRRRAASAPPTAEFNRLLLRVVSAVANQAMRHPRQLAVEVVASLDHGLHLVEFLKLCRQHELWTPRNARWPSALSGLELHSDEGEQDRAVNAAVDRALPGVGSDVRRQLGQALLLSGEVTVGWSSGGQVIPTQR